MTGLVSALEARVADLQSPTRTSVDGVEQLAAVLSAYQIALDRLGGLLAKMARLDISHRRVAIEQAKLMLVVEAIKRAVDQPEFMAVIPDYDTRRQVLAAIGSELRSVPTL